MRIKEILNERMTVYFKNMQGSNLIGVTETGQTVSIDMNKYQIDLPQHDDTDTVTIFNRRQPVERTRLLRQLRPGTPISVQITDRLSA